MRKSWILLSVVLIWSAGPLTVAQDKPQSPKTTTPPVTSEGERPKNEVDERLEEAKKRGELVLVRCLENCGEKEKIEGDDIEVGRTLELPKPKYPAIARAAHASGQVVVQLLIDKDGAVIAAAAVSGHPLLYGASVAAARQARFSPTTVKGEPVKVTGVITYTFVSQ
jgi:TonB family protein